MAELIIPRANAPHIGSATTDPLMGTQEHPDQIAEVVADPEIEAAAWPTSGAPEKSRVLAGTLGILLGGTGAHRFYLGYYSIAWCQFACFALTVGATIAYAVTVGMDPLSTFAIAIGTTVPVFFWGTVEGFMILGGEMKHDGKARPLK